MKARHSGGLREIRAHTKSCAKEFFEEVEYCSGCYDTCPCCMHRDQRIDDDLSKKRKATLEQKVVAYSQSFPVVATPSQPSPPPPPKPIIFTECELCSNKVESHMISSYYTTQTLTTYYDEIKLSVCNRCAIDLRTAPTKKPRMLKKIFTYRWWYAPALLLMGNPFTVSYVTGFIR